MSLYKLNKSNVFFLVLVGFLLAALSTNALAMKNADKDFFKDLYDMAEQAATGYLARSIAIIGGLIGLIYGAAQAKAMIAGIGVVLAIFGALGPQIIEAVFGSALI